jgi:hypothetical protein
MAMSRSFGGTPLTTRSSILISPALTVSRPAIMASRSTYHNPKVRLAPRIRPS